MRGFRALLKEAKAASLAQPVFSLLTIVIVTGMIMTVMLTTGRTVAAEQSVLSTIDSANTRSIVVRADDKANLTSSVISRLANVSGIEWIGAFSSGQDATNALVKDGNREAVRSLYTKDLTVFGLPNQIPLAGQLAYISDEASFQLGLADGAGAIRLTSGMSYNVGGLISVPEFLRSLDPLMIVPKPDFDGTEPVNLIVVLTQRPENVAPVSDLVELVLGVDSLQGVTVETSKNLAELRSMIQGQISSFSHGLVLLLLALTGILIAVILFGLIMMRRKDFGRRRALGASKIFIINFVLLQTGLLAAVGIVIGNVVSALILLLTAGSLPGLSFVLATSILMLTTALLSALAPAVFASRREPIQELRVP